MRRYTLPIALVGLLVSASPAFAGAGLPTLASLEAGSYKVQVSNDSPFMHTGSNTLTVAGYDLPEGAKVSLTLTGPGGETVPVPLAHLTVVEGPADAHGAGAEAEQDEADGHEAAATDAHGGDTHGEAAATEAGHGGDEHDTPASYNARGAVRLNTTGEWTARLQIEDANGRKSEATFHFDVDKGGPSRFYLAFTGTLMGGTMLYGAVSKIQSKRSGGGK